MNNVYSIIFNKFPEDCARKIFSFFRPINPNSIKIKEIFYYCYRCKKPLETKNSKIQLCKFKHYPKYIFCNIDNFIFCEHCSPYSYKPLNLN